MSNFISLVNEHCQKNKLSPPVDTYLTNGTAWSCSMMFQGQHVDSPFFPSKQAAKMACAEIVYNSLVKEPEFVIPNKKCTIFIDGDQRMDCWKWLSMISIPDQFLIKIFVSPITPDLQVIGTEVVRAKTTSKDSADANMLIEIGKQLINQPVLFEDNPFIIVSADHILVQAAQDYGLLYAYNLSSFKEVLKNLYAS